VLSFGKPRGLTTERLPNVQPTLSVPKSGKVKQDKNASVWFIVWVALAHDSELQFDKRRCRIGGEEIRHA